MGEVFPILSSWLHYPYLYSTNLSTLIGLRTLTLYSLFDLTVHNTFPLYSTYSQDHSLCPLSVTRNGSSHILSQSVYGQCTSSVGIVHWVVPHLGTSPTLGSTLPGGWPKPGLPWLLLSLYPNCRGTRVQPVHGAYPSHIFMLCLQWLQV